jgi:hypothetical protein
MTITIKAEITGSACVGQRLEDLVHNKAKEGKLVVVNKDTDLVMGYWSLIFDLCKGPGGNGG